MSSDNQNQSTPWTNRVSVWHITFATYGTRLHGCDRPTVDRKQSHPGDPYVIDQPKLERYERDLMASAEVNLHPDQRAFVETIIPVICLRGRWIFVACASASNHVHALIGVPKTIHGREARKWLKRWLSESLSERWKHESPWWAKGGSARVVKRDEYFHRCVAYINAQRSTPVAD